MKDKIGRMALGAVAGVVVLVAQQTQANVTYELNNINLSGYTGPYGSVTVDLTSSTMATITFNDNVVGSDIYLFDSVYLNVNATAFTATGFSPTYATGFGPATYTAVGSATGVGGFGPFNEEIKSVPNGFSSAATSLSFTLTDTSGTWSSAGNVLSDSAGYFAAEHVIIATNPPNINAGALVTGYAAGNQTPRVPDGGSTVIMLGSAMMGFAWARARFSRKQNAA